MPITSDLGPVVSTETKGLLTENRLPDGVETAVGVGSGVSIVVNV